MAGVVVAAPAELEVRRFKRYRERTRQRFDRAATKHRLRLRGYADA